MNAQRLAIGLTLTNIVLLAFLLGRSAWTAEDVAPVLKGRALQILDERGRVRASIAVLPADPSVKMPDGSTGYPETVLLRLINSKGGPNVKLAAIEDGSALVLGGEPNPTHIQLLARGASTSLKLTDRDGNVQTVKP
jgi:hypothetical protein